MAARCDKRRGRLLRTANTLIGCGVVVPPSRRMAMPIIRVHTQTAEQQAATAAAWAEQQAAISRLVATTRVFLPSTSCHASSSLMLGPTQSLTASDHSANLRSSTSPCMLHTSGHHALPACLVHIWYTSVYNQLSVYSVYSVYCPASHQIGVF